jgi:hypothetical protein
MRSCAELRRVRRSLRLQRWLPGLACMAGLYGISIPLTTPTYDLDAEWIEFTTRQAREAAVEDAA